MLVDRQEPPAALLRRLDAANRALNDRLYDAFADDDHEDDVVMLAIRTPADPEAEPSTRHHA